MKAVAVATDYIGLGPVGERHPYLSRVSEANSVIDAVRAARNLRTAHAGRRWIAIGGSQGGHAVLSANELGERRAPARRLPRQREDGPRRPRRRRPPPPGRLARPPAPPVADAPRRPRRHPDLRGRRGWWIHRLTGETTLWTMKFHRPSGGFTG